MTEGDTEGNSDKDRIANNQTETTASEERIEGTIVSKEGQRRHGTWSKSQMEF